MKKIILILIVSILSAQYVKSQVLISLLFGDKLNSDKIEFGLEGGFNFSTIRNLPESSRYLTTLNLGMYFDIKLDENLFIHTGVLVKSPMGVANLKPYELGEPDLDSVLADGRVDRRLGYFNVPVLLRYRFFDYTHIEGGINMGLRNKAVDEFTVDVFDKEDLVFKSDVGDDYKRIDIGFMVGVGYKLVKGTGANLGVRYYLGMANILKDNPGDPQRNSSIYIYGGIPIGAGKAKKKREAKEKEG
jgi:hypothetical protein